MSELEWRPIPSIPPYEATACGQIRHAGVGKPLRPFFNRTGYKRFHFKPRGGGKQQNIMVHRAVAEAFIGPPDGLLVHHKDGDKTNNNLSNLEYVTASQNVQHAYDTGLAKGRTAPRGTREVLCPGKVRIIRDLITIGCNDSEVARIFSIGNSTVARVRKRETWAGVT